MKNREWQQDRAGVANGISPKAMIATIDRQTDKRTEEILVSNHCQTRGLIPFMGRKLF